MTRVYNPGIRGYTNVTTGLGRFLLVLTGAYLVFKPQETKAQETPYRPPFTERLEVKFLDFG